MNFDPSIGLLGIAVVTFLFGPSTRQSRENRVRQDIALVKDLREHEEREKIRFNKDVMDRARSRVLRSLYRYQNNRAERWTGLLLGALLLAAILTLLADVVFAAYFVLMRGSEVTPAGVQAWGVSLCACLASLVIFANVYGNFYTRDDKWSAREAEMLALSGDDESAGS